MFPLERGPKGPQKCTIVDDCAQIAESGLKPPFESPQLGFPDSENAFSYLLFFSRIVVFLPLDQSAAYILGLLQKKNSVLGPFLGK